MSDTHRMVTVVCDGDRRPNVTRELLTIEDCIRAHAQMVAKEKAAKQAARSTAATVDK